MTSAVTDEADKVMKLMNNTIKHNSEKSSGVVLSHVICHVMLSDRYFSEHALHIL